jgi:hypothetical protein
MDELFYLTIGLTIGFVIGVIACYIDCKNKWGLFWEKKKKT